MRFYRIRKPRALMRVIVNTELANPVSVASRGSHFQEHPPRWRGKNIVLNKPFAGSSEFLSRRAWCGVKRIRMVKDDASDSDTDSEVEESESEENLSLGDEAEGEVGSERSDGKQGISEYEKQRLSRIAENNARMEALGLRKMASSLIGTAHKSSQQPKGKKKAVDDCDEDYKPIDDACTDDDDEDDEEFSRGHFPLKSRQHKGTSKGCKTGKGSVQKNLSSEDFVEEDDDLMKAIALSLQDSKTSECLTERRDNAQIQEDTGRKKRKKSKFTSRVQMTEDELILHFFQFDEAGKGSITIRDLERVAIAHNFMWTDKELADMIYCFDNNGDGKLSLEDFQKIVGRCNMVQGSENH